MIRHIVFWRLQDEALGATKAENAARITSALESLTQHIPSIRTLHVGSDIGADSGAWDLMLLADFDSAEHLAEYQAHPAHVEVAELIGQIRTDRAVIDCELPAGAFASTAAADALASSRAETRASFENRALIYAYMLDELEDEIGLEAATKLMKRAIYRRGNEIGLGYRDAVEAGDLAEVGRRFVAGSPCAGALFEPGIDEPAEGGRTVLRMTACPLVETWQTAGYDVERVDLLCEIASAIDYGTFDAAGLELRFLDRQACAGSVRCLLELKPAENEGTSQR